jgi:glycogen debranching enzyme
MSERLREQFVAYGEPIQHTPSFAELDARGDHIERPFFSAQEFPPPITDQRDHLPRRTQGFVSPEEVVVDAVRLRLPRYPETPPLSRWLAAATGVKDPRLIDEFGLPPVASLPARDREMNPALNRFGKPHGRDALEIIRFIGHRYPGLAARTLTHLAAEGGIVEEEFRDGYPYRQERPGEVMLVNFGYESDIGRKFARYLGWGAPIFTSVDAGSMWLADTADHLRVRPRLLEQPYLARDGKWHPLGQFFDLATHRKAEDQASSKDGFIEFKNQDPRPGHGMLNQGWADSAPAYRHADGSWANHNDGISAAEVQGYTYDAYRKAANIYRLVFNEPEKADELEGLAEELRDNFLNKYFVDHPEYGAFAAMGRDYDENGEARNLAVRHVNGLLAVLTSIMAGNRPDIVEKREGTIRTMMSEGMITPYGLRTMHEDEAAFHPGGDHTGSIWLHINEKAAQGSIALGLYGVAHYLRNGNRLTMMETNAANEYIRGDSVRKVRHNPRDITVLNGTNGWVYKKEIPGQLRQTWAIAALLRAQWDYADGIPTAATDPAAIALEQEILPKLPKQKFRGEVLG